MAIAKLFAFYANAKMEKTKARKEVNVEQFTVE